ncbi:hypothetical protein K1719_037444 [Acacia pycnantha]|nr:hypothetical protein K1719_037444 [Acacia pycnantha]
MASKTTCRDMERTEEEASCKVEMKLSSSSCTCPACDCFSLYHLPLELDFGLQGKKPLRKRDYDRSTATQVRGSMDVHSTSREWAKVE